jgi:hypothetical protein
MGHGKNSSILTDTDDLLHQSNKDLKWRESYYFNWVDLENKISGFSTIGILPNEKKRELVFLLFLDNKMEIYYKEPPIVKYENNISIMLQDNRLSYKMIKPLQIWEISYNSRKLKLDLSFETRFFPYDFGKESSGSWQRHFEASGVVSGEIRLKDNNVLKINGFGQRNKSWGYRNWHQFDQWFAGHFQFKNWSCGFRKDYIDNRVDLSGFITDESGNASLDQLDIETINDKDQFHSPLISNYVIIDAKGRKLIIKSKRIENNSYIRFVRDFPGGFTELFEQMVIMKNIDTGEIGTGMSEQLRTVRLD